jgi:2-oxoglutarate dehydrogenase E1 component
MNQGAWYAMQHRMRQVILLQDDSLYLAYAGRDAFAAPAVGYASIHNEQQMQLVQDALFG